MPLSSSASGLRRSCSSASTTRWSSCTAPTPTPEAPSPRSTTAPTSHKNKKPPCRASVRRQDGFLFSPLAAEPVVLVVIRIGRNRRHRNRMLLQLLHHHRHRLLQLHVMTRSDVLR